VGKKKPLLKTLGYKKGKHDHLLIALSDIAHADTVCDILIKRGAELRVTEPTVNRALLNSLVISYARPFKSNFGYDKLPADLSKFTNKKLKSLHTDLIIVRDKVVAHSDKDMIKIETQDTLATVYSKFIHESEYENIKTLCVLLIGKLTEMMGPSKKDE